MTARLKDILKGIRYRADRDIGSIRVGSIADDSRKVSRGCLFIAARGYSADGADFIGMAIKNGAGAIVAEKDFKAPEGVAKILVDDSRQAAGIIADNFYNSPSRRLKVVGVTGTNGKTTITYIIESIVNASGADAGVIGTINYRIKGRAVPAKNTTPGALDLQGMLGEMVRRKVKFAVMEVSSHSLDQGRVDRVLFDAGIFTNITGDHLDYHKTAANYFKAKKRLFDRLKDTGTAILNADDRKVAGLARLMNCKVVTYGVKTKADVMSKDVAMSMRGTDFTLVTPAWSAPVHTRLIGAHNVSNILASVSAAISLKIPRKAILKGIGSVANVPGRLEIVDAGQPFMVFVDFAHTADALLNVLTLLRQVARRRIVTVFGCGGNRDRTKRPVMGRIACRYSDHVIITSDNPRFEDPRAITDEIEAGIKDEFSNYDVVIDRAEAIGKALGCASGEDIVMIAGKGHENCQIIKDEAIPYNDCETALDVLRRLTGGRPA
ncbi:MAG: UDP-N-acetylmuramoyl-L-alanyl-D-glutamate--2,6-diaminopimelate ligase [Candidatus Omnitrophica bacterium]|nr:UDP-N-acetylmuramoyl-L-alanyl-D-glutamate--2,6-diaminopimelate ligase [Candidatus Omnitrophota bacterium]